MNKILSKMFLTRTVIVIYFLIMFWLSIIDCAWGGSQMWERNYTRVFKDVKNNTIFIRFKFYNHAFDLEDVNCFLVWCDFYYSTNASKYTKFMRAESQYQKITNGRSFLYMKDKLPDARLHFTDCCSPNDGTRWFDILMMQMVEVKNIGNESFATIKWVLSQPFENVRFIKVVGNWHIDRFLNFQFFNQTYEVTPIRSELKTESKQINLNVARIDSTGNKAVRIYKEAGTVNIKGAVMGANINVFTISGEKIKSSVANNDIIKIKHPMNNIYIVHIGQTSYKVAL